MGKNKEIEPNPEDLLAEEMKKPYYKVDYLDDFKLPYDKLDVSIVIPTYNRCPYKANSLKRELNPLAWALDSCLLQKPIVSEIIIIDDDSDDHTADVVESFEDKAREKGIKLIYIKNKDGQRGNGGSRNIGSRAANSKYLFYTDDDLIIAPYSVFGAYHTIKLLEKKDRKVGMVGLPVYFRESASKKIVSKEEIGSLSFLKGTFSANKDAFAKELIEEENKASKFIDNELNILNPLLIHNANGYGICLKQAFEEVGGSPETIVRGEDREFGSKLIENAYSIYFSCDPKFQGVHGMFGFECGKEFSGEDWFRKVGGDISLRKSMKECDRPLSKTGARVDVNEYIYQQILSFFYLTYPRNKKGALNWIKKVYKDFVIGGETGLFGNQNMPIPNLEERKKMWLSAINNGLGFIRDSEEEGLRKINVTIKELQKEHSINTDILDILGEL
ncbi:glycosyltransferase family 2 protein [Candidatus Pacearchaeota archaeon]|nr:glycosyltransferase family 2 protein [Candidatus Pacearchaeota archaeon]